MPKPRSVAHKLIESHLLDGSMEPGAEVGLRMDQTLTQDATGTLVMLELEALGLDRVQTEVSAQYVDHNLIQEDFKNADDHIFLHSACRRFGIWFSRPGNGVSHPVHMSRLGRPGRTLLGSDSHTCAAGALGMLAMGAGGIEVAMAMVGRPFYVRMPQVWGVHLTGTLPPFVSAKDVILEMLRRHGVRGGLGRIIEYHGPGLARARRVDRHVIANMGAELGATSTVFPSDGQTRRFLQAEERADAFTAIVADAGAAYDVEDAIDLSSLEPLIAKPSSPGNVVPVREVAGEEIYQAYIGSSANPGFRDFAVAAAHGARHEGRPARLLRHQPDLPRHPRGPDARAAGSSTWCMPARACIRLAATAASAWARRRRPGGTACAPCRATSRGARAPGRTACGCAARRRRRPLPCAA